MKILILSRRPSLYSTRRLWEAARKRGHQVEIRDPLRFSLSIGNPLGLEYMFQPLPLPDVIIPRIGASITYFGTSLLRQFEKLEVFSLNSSAAIIRSRDKLRALQALAAQGVPIPSTSFVRWKSDLSKGIESVGGLPVVLKMLEGTHGTGVVLAEDLPTAKALMEFFQVAKKNFLIQKFVAEARGTDIRAFVVGDRVVASMRRTAGEIGEFRSNLHRGGNGESIEISSDCAKLAIQASRAVGLEIAGVDLLESKLGPLVIEVNSSPGLNGIETVTKVDIAAEIMDHLDREFKKAK